PWFANPGRPSRLYVSDNLKCDALVIGAGITGSLVAERLTRQGLDVVIIDRPLRELSEIYGFERAARAYRASLDAVAGLKSLVAQLGIACEMREKNSL